MIDLKTLRRSPQSDATPATARSKYPTGIIAALAAAVVVIASLGVYYLVQQRQPQAQVTSGEQIRSIAVLPFKPLVIDERDETLELGMADTLITKLSNIRQVDVRPISAVRKYTGLEQDALAAGRDQQVDP